MTNAEKAAELRKAMDLLEDAEEILNIVLGNNDALGTHRIVKDAIENLQFDIMELEFV